MTVARNRRGFVFSFRHFPHWVRFAYGVDCNPTPLWHGRVARATNRRGFVLSVDAFAFWATAN
jgi:hypothetical protein